MIFNIVFFITITSALIQGSIINVFAQYLGLSKANAENKNIIYAPVKN